ncbi:TetR/AcrR family transcriptional regulator [Streptomyces scabiei]|uniref:TetR/AcrR family transcriptional regulator n=1 Tax=Streptomyces scabiei TaxID=1930 RepID=UPI00298FDE57|nr:TetR/AcrR family transcriptional regulator [Streptomyces scabiei]MDW8809011.1 TetR/AcrR family transcriptional regulator [Streptomyces scabiei]
MQKRAELTRQALVRATAELIADGQLSDAGLINICSRAGVSRGALYHHFPSTGSLAAAVYDQAHQRVVALTEKAFEGRSADALERFSVALGDALHTEEIVRAGMRLAADGSVGPPRLRDDLLTMVHQRVADAHQEITPPAQDLADLAIVVVAGLESLGHSGVDWWGSEVAQRVWGLLRPVFLPDEPTRK